MSIDNVNNRVPGVLNCTGKLHPVMPVLSNSSVRQTQLGTVQPILSYKSIKGTITGSGTV